MHCSYIAIYKISSDCDLLASFFISQFILLFLYKRWIAIAMLCIVNDVVINYISATFSKAIATTFIG